MELIGPRVKIAVEGLAPVSGLLPRAVASFELVAVLNSLRNHIAERRIVDLEIACQRREAKVILGSIFFAIGDDSLEIDRRRHLIPYKVSWVNRLQNTRV